MEFKCVDTSEVPLGEALDLVSGFRIKGAFCPVCGERHSLRGILETKRGKDGIIIWRGKLGCPHQTYAASFKEVAFFVRPDYWCRLAIDDEDIRARHIDEYARVNDALVTQDGALIVNCFAWYEAIDEGRSLARPTDHYLALEFAAADKRRLEEFYQSWANSHKIIVEFGFTEDWQSRGLKLNFTKNVIQAPADVTKNGK